MQGLSPHIYYTDDDADDQELFRGALSEVDCNLVLTTINSGEALLDLLSSPAPVPRIIFLDLNMPRSNGFDVLQKLRRDAITRDYPVVVFSTTSDPVAVNRTREMGANMFVPKPYTYNGIKQAIRTCVNMDWQHFNASGPDYLMRFN